MFVSARNAGGKTNERAAMSKPIPSGIMLRPRPELVKRIRKLMQRTGEKNQHRTVIELIETGLKNKEKRQ